MKTKNQLINPILLGAFVLTLCVSFAPRALAVEGGLGRPISGMQIAPFAGVIPPEPGLAVLTGDTYYEGSIGGGLSVPIAGLLVANVDMKASFTPITLLYIWNTPTKEWNFASVVSFPLARCRFGKPRALSDCSIWLLLPSWQAITLVRLIISRSTSHFGHLLDHTKRVDWST